MLSKLRQAANIRSTGLPEQGIVKPLFNKPYEPELLYFFLTFKKQKNGT